MEFSSPEYCSLLHGIFKTQEVNPGFPHCRLILYQLSHKGSPRILERVADPFSSRSFQTRNQTGVSCIAGGFFTSWATRTITICNLALYFPSEMKSLSRVRLFATPWTVAYQAPQSMGFSRQECWSGLPFPSPGGLPDPGIEPRSPTMQADTLPSEPQVSYKCFIILS